MYERFSSNSDVNASDLLEKLEEIYYMNSVKFSIFKTSQYYVDSVKGIVILSDGKLYYSQRQVL